MRGKLLLYVAITVLIFSGLMFASGKTDLTGTWEGETYVEGGPTLLLTLTLEHKGDAITGTLADDMGYIDSEITEAKLEGEAFTFQAVAQTPAGEVALNFKVTVAGDSMEGAWESEDGAYSGEWTATRGK
ncbi:hypothetical protein ACFLT2_12770 [Acidobacteriota bacterium]